MKKAIEVLEKYLEQVDYEVGEVLKGEVLKGIDGYIDSLKLEYLTRRQWEIQLCINKLKESA